MEDDEEEPKAADVLLKRQAPVNGDERVETALRQGQQIAVVPAGPPHFGNRFDVMSAQDPAQTARQALVEEDAQGVTRLVLIDRGDELTLGSLQKLNHLLS